MHKRLYSDIYLRALLTWFVPSKEELACDETEMRIVELQVDLQGLHLSIWTVFLFVLPESSFRTLDTPIKFGVVSRPARRALICSYSYRFTRLRLLETTVEV